VLTGLALQVKKDVPWIQPTEQAGGEVGPQISFAQILAICAALPDVQVRGWEDIQRLDYRPAKGLVKVTTAGNWEIQIDPADGRVLQVAIRRSDLIESLHDGSWFGDLVKRGVFLPAGLSLVVLWGSGVYMFFLPVVRRRRSAARPG
jgi:hypothetical protein